MEELKPVAFEDWTADIFVPFSPRHDAEADLSPEFPSGVASELAECFDSDVAGKCNSKADLSPEFPCGVASQLAECFASDVAGQCNLQLPNDEVLESIENAIDTEVRELLSKCASYSVPDEDDDDADDDTDNDNDDDDDGSLEDNVSGDNCMSDSHVENKTDSCSDSDSSVDNDVCIPPCLKAEDDIFTSSKQTSQCNLDSSCLQRNSTCGSSVVEDWLAKYHTNNINNASVFKDGGSAKGLVNATKTPSKCDSNQMKPTAGNTVLVADSHTDNGNNASAFKKRKEKQRAKSSDDVNKTPSKCDDDMSKSIHFDQSVISKDGNQEAYCPCEQQPTFSACNYESSDTQVKRWPSKSKSQLSKVSLPRKDKKKKSICKFSVVPASDAKNWKVTNISKRCSLFTYKQEILRQPYMNQPHMNFSRQVSLRSFSMSVHI